MVIELEEWHSRGNCEVPVVSPLGGMAEAGIAAIWGK